MPTVGGRLRWTRGAGLLSCLTLTIMIKRRMCTLDYMPHTSFRNRKLYWHTWRRSHPYCIIRVMLLVFTCCVIQVKYVLVVSRIESGRIGRMMLMKTWGYQRRGVHRKKERIALFFTHGTRERKKKRFTQVYVFELELNNKNLIERERVCGQHLVYYI